MLDAGCSILDVGRLKRCDFLWGGRRPRRWKVMRRMRVRGSAGGAGIRPDSASLASRKRWNWDLEPLSLAQKIEPPHVGCYLGDERRGWLDE